MVHSGTALDDFAGAYVLAVENFERAAHSVYSDLGVRGVPVDTSSIADASSAAAAGPLLFFSLSFPPSPNHHQLVTPLVFLVLIPVFVLLFICNKFCSRCEFRILLKF